uniref:Sequence orphan n=1 Tax=Globisporangium ultimum (strain ATCC 200006 / CBS 805.95 / DAOM BR144) TaxID=431595 RepID=K3WSU5_GLOUD
MPTTIDRQQTRESMVVVAKNLAIDLAAAAAASFAVSPFITIVDRAIIENASGARPLAVGIKELSKAFVANPFQFVRKREFIIVFGLYTSTYASANAIDTVCEWAEADNQMPKFLGTTAVNMTLCIAKDRAFAQMFGVVAPSAFPIGAIGLFAIRDSLTVGASFNAPKTVAKKLEVDGGVEPSRAKTLAQLLCPAAVQFVSTPLHLLGLDLYNNKGASVAARFRFVQREYLKSAVARIGRIGPAFGIGGVGNTYCRENLRATFN